MRHDPARGGTKGLELYGSTGSGALPFWECEKLLAAARKRPVRPVFTKEWPDAAPR